MLLQLSRGQLQRNQVHVLSTQTDRLVFLHAPKCVDRFARQCCYKPSIRISPDFTVLILKRTTFLKTLCGDDKNFGSSSYDIKLVKNESAVGRVWAGSSAETIDRPADDEQFAHQQLAKDFKLQHHQDLLQSLCRRCLGVGLQADLQGCCGVETCKGVHTD